MIWTQGLWSQSLYTSTTNSGRKHYSCFNCVFLLFSGDPERLRDLSKLVLAALSCKASSRDFQVCALSSTSIKPSSFCPASCRSRAKMRKGPREQRGWGEWLPRPGRFYTLTSTLVGGRTHQHIPRDCCGDAAAFLVRLTRCCSAGALGQLASPGAPVGSGRSRPCAAESVTSAAARHSRALAQLQARGWDVVHGHSEHQGTLVAPASPHSLGIPFHRGGAAARAGWLVWVYTDIQV